MATRPNPNWDRRKIRKLRERLLAWYRHHRRVLPWRSLLTPYRVWIAEIMLQQTRVETVRPYYDRFMQRFPDIESLAAASEQDVLEQWAGLGYYRRARLLRDAARKVVEESGGEFPGTIEGMLALPGIGRYTAGAISSIAFRQPHAAVDGNVMRVIGRLQGIAAAPERYFWEQAESWLAREEPDNFNQAVMELGALVCIPGKPRCGQCPLRTLCRAARHEIAPGARKCAARALENVEMVLLIVECRGSILLRRQRPGEFVPGIWGLPFLVLQGDGRSTHAARRLARAVLGVPTPLTPRDPVRHAITHRVILAHVYHAMPASRPSRHAGKEEYAWFPRPGVEPMLTSSLFRKALARSTPA